MYIILDIYRAWPQPVILKAIEEGTLALRVWNPRLYLTDRAHRMPVITPAYPSMCSTHNVTLSTQLVQIQNFKTAADIADRIMIGKAKWKDLFSKHDFFQKYKYYLQIIASSDDEDMQRNWSGTVESKLRQLVLKLEVAEHLEIAHPFIKGTLLVDFTGFDRVTHCANETEKNDAAHGTFPVKEPLPEPMETPQQEKEVAPSEIIYTTTFYIGLAIKPKDPNSTAPRKLDISWAIGEFMKMVKGSDTFDEEHMGIVVQYIKSASLPADVFEDGDRPPVKKRTKNERVSFVYDLVEPKQ